MQKYIIKEVLYNKARNFYQEDMLACFKDFLTSGKLDTDTNISQVSDISRSYIFINNDRVKSTKDKLQSILIDINAELQYYKRLYDDLHNILENKHKKLSTMQCPSIEEINKANISERINLQEQREKYIEQCNKTNGLYEYFQDITKQLRHYETLQYKIESILNIK